MPINRCGNSSVERSEAVPLTKGNPHRLYLLPVEGRRGGGGGEGEEGGGVATATGVIKYN